MHTALFTSLLPPSLPAIFCLSHPHSEVQGLGEGSINDEMLPLTLALAVCEETIHASAEGRCSYFDPKTAVISLSPHE